MSNSYIPNTGQQWNQSPNQFNIHLQLEHDLDFTPLSAPAINNQQRQQHQQSYNYQYPNPTPPQSSSSLNGVFTMPTNQQSPQISPTHYSNNGNLQNSLNTSDYALYPNQQSQQSATRIPVSNSYRPTNFDFSSRATPSAMNLDTAQTSNVSSFRGSAIPETQQRQPYYHFPSTNSESVPQIKRARSVAYNDDPNSEDADPDSEPSPSNQKGPANRSKLYVLNQALSHKSTDHL